MHDARCRKRLAIAAHAQSGGRHIGRQRQISDAAVAGGNQPRHQLRLAVGIVGHHRRCARFIKAVGQHQGAMRRRRGQAHSLMKSGHINHALGAVLHKSAHQGLNARRIAAGVGNHQGFAGGSHHFLRALNQKHIRQASGHGGVARTRNRAGDQADQPRAVGAHRARSR